MMLAVTILLLVFVGWVIWLFNTLLTLSNEADMIWADIDSQFKRRHELIPRLIEMSKPHLAQEPDAFAVIQAAHEAGSNAYAPDEKSRTEPAVAATVGVLLARSEAFPALKASETFCELRRILFDIETYVQQSRKYYNAKIRILNHHVQSFPGSLVARALGVRTRAYYLAEP